LKRLRNRELRIKTNEEVGNWNKKQKVLR